MASATIASFTSIPGPPAATIYAEMRYGTNGSDGGLPECLIGHSGTDASSGRIVWDASDDAFDSGDAPFDFNMPAGGGTANPDWLSVQGAITNPINYSLTTYGPISSVQIGVGVQINGSASIISLVVQFYKNGVLTDSYDNGSQPAVDTTTASNPTAVQVITITPATSNNDQVRISGGFRMTVPAGTYPDVDDLFGQIFVSTSSASHGPQPKPGPPGQPTN